ncbi:hypothetical protein IMSAG049_00129 [Clostridiales bacterium]|nr:hypothetical protein IMSAG049_00129 [Clostridiales bacterium]
MSVVIIGGNERMERQYEQISKIYGYKAKVFTKEASSLKRKIGSPDLLIVFTDTVSHSMTACAMQEAKKIGANIVRTHNSSAAALHEVMKGQSTKCN